MRQPVGVKGLSMRSRPAATALAAVILLVLPSAVVAQDRAAFPDAMDAFARRALARTEAVPGMAVAVADDRGAVYTAGFGAADVATGAPVDADTRFYIASSTKSFTALAIAAMAARGEVDLEAPAFVPQADRRDERRRGNEQAREPPAVAHCPLRAGRRLRGSLLQGRQATQSGHGQPAAAGRTPHLVARLTGRDDDPLGTAAGQQISLHVLRRGDRGARPAGAAVPDGIPRPAAQTLPAKSFTIRDRISEKKSIFSRKKTGLRDVAAT